MISWIKIYAVLRGLLSFGFTGLMLGLALYVVLDPKGSYEHFVVPFETTGTPSELEIWCERNGKNERQDHLMLKGVDGSWIKARDIDGRTHHLGSCECWLVEKH
jgi:hypothetical protein